VFVLPGAFAFKDMKGLAYYGCFKSDPSATTLDLRDGDRGKVNNGQGFTTLQSCAKACARKSSPMKFVGMNRDGCFCSDTAPNPEGPMAVKDKSCQDSKFNPSECGLGPCGGAPTTMVVYSMASNKDIAKGGGVTYEGAGNAFVEARVVLALAFSADWTIRAQGLGFDGRLQIRRRGETILAVDAGEQTGDSVAIETVVNLIPGTYTILAYGVYDAQAEATAREGKYLPAILFKEPKYCKMTEFTPIKAGALDCVVRTRLNVDPDKIRTVVKSRVKIPASKSETAPNSEELCSVAPTEASYGGAFLNVHFSASDADFHFVFKGQFTLLFLKVTIDVEIKTGSADEGGGIHGRFEGGMVDPKSGEDIWKVVGNFDLVPLDLKKITSFDIAALAQTEVSMGIGFVPSKLNDVLAVLERPIKIALKIIFYVPLKRSRSLSKHFKS
jgi:hypothetical protein